MPTDEQPRAAGRRVPWPRRRRSPRGAAAGPAVAPEPTPPVCWAPSRALHLLPDGEVRSCCAATRSLGNARRTPLSQIWAGERRTELVSAIADGDFGLGCDACGDEVAAEGEAHAYPRQFDRFAPDPVGASVPADAGWPAMLGLYFANTCNLQCVQCHGGWSSAIRKHREGRPPLRTGYDDTFFDELRPFLAKARHVLLAGGEPFLVPEAMRTLELLGEVGSAATCTVITNGTQWNERVERALGQHPCSIIVSIDGATPETFGAVRVGADLTEVLANLDRFCAYAADAGTTVEINHCLMTANHHEFADLLILASERGIGVNVSVVREPEHLSLASWGPERLQEVLAGFASRDAEVRARAPRNLATWEAEVARVQTWAARPEGAGSGGPSSHTIVMFPVRGAGPLGPGTARDALAAIVPGRPVHEVDVAVDDVVASTSPEVDAVLGLEPPGLVGRPIADLWGALTTRFGRSRSLDEVARDDDLAHLVATFADRRVEVVAAAVRDADGVAARCELAFAIVDQPSSSARSTSGRITS